jgi:uncharacterized protein YkwD
LHTTRRLAALTSAGLLLISLATAAIAAPVSATTSSDTLGDEIMRLTNLDRQALGKSRLAIDTTLVAFARGMSWTCPNTTLVLGGRSVDMARRDYFSHAVKSCRKSDGSLYSSLDIMKLRFGFATTRGENIAWNKGYSTTTSVTYGVGCPYGVSGIAGSGCKSSTTTNPSVGVTERGWMNSTGHRANILGGWDRFGCASGTASDGGIYYTCVFSLGGPDQPVTDAVLPRVTSETGKSGNYPHGYARNFYATISDNVGLKTASVYFDGVRIKSWSFDGTTTSQRLVVNISASRMKTGYHTLVWRVHDTSGLGSVYSDGKVRYHCY